MLKRLLISAIAALGLVFGTAGVAGASTGPVSPHASAPGHFSYFDPLFGQVSCNEVHNPSNNLPANFPAGATTQGGYDTVTCNLAAPSELAGQTFTEGWFSDFGTQFDQNVGLIKSHVSDDGLTFHGIAWYPDG
jgi:hypothetical protein